MKKLMSGKSAGAVVLVAGALVVGASGGAVSSALITGAQIQNGSVTGVDIKNGTLGSADVANGSITGTDLKDGLVGGVDIKDGSVALTELAKGARTWWAVVAEDGTIARSSAGVTSGLVGNGFEVLFPVDVTGCAFVASVGNTDAGNTLAGTAAAGRRSGNPNGVFVQTRDGAGTVDHRSFHIIVDC